MAKISREERWALVRGVNAARPLLDAVALVEDAAKKVIAELASGVLVYTEDFTEEQFEPFVDLAYEKGLMSARHRVDEVLDEIENEEARLNMEAEADEN